MPGCLPTGERPDVRLAAERSVLLPLPPKAIVRPAPARTARRPMPIESLQHPLSVYDALLTGAAA